MKQATLGLILLLVLGAPARAQDPPSELVVGIGNFIHAVTDVERSLEFYRDVLGMTLQAGANGQAPPSPRPFLATTDVPKLYGAVGGQFRTGTTLVQGAPMRAELIEFKDIDRRASTRRIQDPGAATLILRVRDIEATLAQVKFKGVTIVTDDAMTIPMKDENGTYRAVMLQDPDGFFVQLVQRDGPVPADAPAGNVIGVSFAVTVDDMDRTMKVFRDVLGFRATPDPTDHEDSRLSMMGVFTAFYRRQWSIVPGTSFQVDFVEVHGLQRRLVSARPRDPGSAILRILVSDIDKTIAALAKENVKVVTDGGGPVTFNNQRYVMLETPDRFFIQLVQRLAQ